MKKEAIFFGAIVLISLIIALLTYDPHTQTTNPVLSFLVTVHAPLMLLMVIVATTFGYYVNKELHERIDEEKRSSKKKEEEIVHLLLRTLPKIEREILSTTLISSKTQAELSAKHGRVQTHRAIKKLREKNLIQTLAKGKTSLIKPTFTLKQK